MDPSSQLPTILALPASLPYPLTIRALLVRPGQRVARGQKLLTYTYAARDERMRTIDSTRVGDARDRDGNGEGGGGGPRVRMGGAEGTRKAGGDWDSAVQGEVVQWAEGIKVGAVISGPGQQAILIQEPCSHPVVFSGLCAVCGKDLDEMTDYLNDAPPAQPSYAGPSRSPPIVDDSYRGGLSIDHEDARIKVSVEEAHRLAQAQRAALLKSRRLIMVVDLDQTVIHAAVDPTIGEWLNECGFWEASRLGSGTAHGQTSGAGRSTTPDGDPSQGSSAGAAAAKGKGKAENPNKAALADVFRFQLPNEMPPGFARGRFSQSLPDDGEGCWYYIKPRPGLNKFLEEMNKVYELHVYTAGSRTYANAVCKGIDPEGKYFGDRILSRDESGNAAQKNLRRLFPADQSMVVVIDDRYEVWNHAANLVKVVPYDFFVGMGDINSAFVAPRAIDDPSPSPPGKAAANAATTDAAGPMDLAVGPDEAAKELLDQQQAHILEEQLLERPLAKKQAELASEGDDDVNAAPPSAVDGSGADSSDATSTTKALLRADDAELDRLQHLLTEIHGRFFDAMKDKPEAYRIPSSLETSPNVMFDVRHIIPHMQRKVLAGCTILFSGIVPLNQQPERNEHWILAKMFGARCVHHLSPEVTHLVTSQADTKKVYQAQKQKGTQVVWKEWLRHSIDTWQRQAEDRYLVKPPAKAVSALTEATEDGTQTRPDSPTSDVGNDLDEEGHLHLNVDFDDMDAEMAAFLAESDSETGSEAPSAKSSPSRTPNKKRPRKSALANEITVSSSPTPEPGTEGVDGKPFAKRARFAAEDGDIATEFADIEEERDVEDYDEYPDEDGAEENAADEEDDAAKEMSGGMLVEDTAMPGEREGDPPEQLQLDLAAGNGEDAKADEALQGRTHANE